MEVERITVDDVAGGLGSSQSDGLAWLGMSSLENTASIEMRRYLIDAFKHTAVN